MSFQDAVRNCLRNYATFAGRARRSEFWWFFLFTLLAQCVAAILNQALFWAAPQGPIGAILSLLLLLPNLAVGARRLHDTGRSGWWLLIWLVPLIGFILLLVWFCSRGEEGANRFGPDPRTLPANGAAGRPWPINPPSTPP